MLTDFFAKRKLRKTFGESVTAEALNSIVEGKPLKNPRIQSGRLEFVFVLQP